MNILHIDTEKGWRGGEQQAWWLIEGLLKRDVGHQIVAVPPASDFESRAREARWDVEQIPMRGGWDLAASARIRAIVRERKIDIVHAHTSHAHNLAWLGVARRGVAPVVVTRRVDFPIAAPGPLGFLRRLKYVHPDVYLIAISAGVRDVLVAGGIEAERITIVPSGIDTKRLEGNHDRSKVRSLVEADEKTAVIGNIAALTDHKGQIYLVRAAAELRAWFQEPGARPPDCEYSDFRIVIVGEGEERGHLEEEIERLGVEGHVRLLGWRDDVPDCLAAFDVFCMPSHLEGLGTSILDAMWMGLPVVATRTGGIPDVITDRETGLMVPPKEPELLAAALIECIRDADLRKCLSQEGRRVVEERFTVDRMVEGTLAVYHSATKR